VVGTTADPGEAIGIVITTINFVYYVTLYGGVD
jgi:hypothetical protein